MWILKIFLEMFFFRVNVLILLKQSDVSVWLRHRILFRFLYDVSAAQSRWFQIAVLKYVKFGDLTMFSPRLFQSNVLIRQKSWEKKTKEITFKTIMLTPLNNCVQNTTYAVFATVGELTIVLQVSLCGASVHDVISLWCV